MNLRAHGREITLKTARIISAISDPMPCAVLNISVDGACLLVAEPDNVTKEFDLVIDHTGNRHSCFVAWRTGHRVGVRFLNSDQNAGRRSTTAEQLDSSQARSSSNAGL